MDYVRVTTELELAEALRPDGASILAGGTDLMVKMRAGAARPKLLVDVSRLAALRRVETVDGALEIGAAAPIDELLAAPTALGRYPLLAAALRSLGSVQIRTRATLGGNLANASPAADSAVALLAYGASVTLASAASTRVIPLEQFLRGPGRTSLEPGEYIRSVLLPEPRAVWRPFFHKVGRRRAMTIAIASVGALLAWEGGRIVDARIAVGSVAPTTLRLRGVEAMLTGRPLDEARIEAVRDAAAQEVRPIDDVRATADYRRDVVGELVARALTTAR